MIGCHDQEILEDFKEQFERSLPQIAQHVDAMASAHHSEKAVNELFRILHSYKALAGYLGLASLHTLLSNAEELLGVMRTNTGRINENTIFWLKTMKEQFDVWNYELQMGFENFSDVHPLLEKVTLLAPERSSGERLKELRLLYIDSNQERASKMTEILGRIVREAYHVGSIEVLRTITSAKPDIILINCGAENFASIAFCQQTFPKAGIIAAFEKLTPNLRLKLALKDITHPISKPIRSEELKRELLNVTTSHFNQRRIIINNKKITQFVQNLSPLPNSLYQIQQICDDPELPIRDLIRVIRQDPVLSGIVLDAANQPIYGLKNITTINQAVTAFGKRTVKALVLGLMHKNMGEQDLSACGMDESAFSQVVALRLALMMRWYVKVSIGALGVLSSTAVLGNIGQLLISREIARYGKGEAFRNYCDLHGADAAVNEFLQTSIAFVSSDILRFWKLDNAIIDSIRYSDEPDLAPEEIKALAWANHIVYQLIPAKGEISTEVPDKLKRQMLRLELDVSVLQQALDQVRATIST